MIVANADNIIWFKACHLLNMLKNSVAIENSMLQLTHFKIFGCIDHFACDANVFWYRFTCATNPYLTFIWYPDTRPKFVFSCTFQHYQLAIYSVYSAYYFPHITCPRCLLSVISRMYRFVTCPGKKLSRNWSLVSGISWMNDEVTRYTDIQWFSWWFHSSSSVSNWDMFQHMETDVRVRFSC